ncbi:DUF3800 domain-containing protein [Primorskyibacter sp. S187A]|uniref:DUF3800 domain-containing protein n=1 Tax=Primorskyibacter sp. S187A TaxID=3415130 RepID=UPI003C7EB6E5
MKFRVFVDESGQTGITKVRSKNSPGASPYFVMGAVVCEPTSEVHLANAIAQFKKEIRKKSWKHASDLGHFEKVLLARELSRLPIRYFATISLKETLGEYKEDIDNDPHKYYNKCLKYLLEQIFGYLGPRLTSCNDVDVILEERNHDYDAMYRYLEKVKRNPLHPNSIALSKMNPFAISVMKKGEAPGLEVADFVAHAVFQCANASASNYGIPEPRYFREMVSRFAGDKSGRVLGVGVKCIHSINQVSLQLEVRKILETACAQLPSKRVS